MVADDVADLRLIDRTVEGDTVVEAVVAFGVFGSLPGRQQGVQLACYLDGVDHLVFGVARVDVAALNLDLGARGVEVLVFEFPLEAAVHRVGEVGAEGLDVEEVHAPADLFVGGEADADLTVPELRMCEQIFRSGHDLRHARLVVGAQQRRAVRVDQRMSLEEAQLRKVRDFHRHAGVQPDVLAVVILYDVRFHVGAAHIGCGVHVGDESDDGGFFAAGRRGDRTHGVAVLVHRDLGEAQGLHLFGQIIEQHPLFRGRGESFARLVALGVERNVFQKSVFEFHSIYR